MFVLVKSLFGRCRMIRNRISRSALMKINVAKREPVTFGCRMDTNVLGCI